MIENESELLGVYDRSGRRIATRPRSEVHRNGDLHWVSFLLAVRREGERGRRMLLQLRGRAGDPYRGNLDCLVGGHVGASETPEQALVRECREEIGIELDPKELLFLGARNLDNPSGVCRRVVDHFFLSTREILLEEMSFTSEAAGFVEIDLAAFSDLLDGRRERIEGRARTRARGREPHPLEVDMQYFRAYSATALENFRRSIRSIDTYLESGAVDQSIWQ